MFQSVAFSMLAAIKQRNVLVLLVSSEARPSTNCHESLPRLAVQHVNSSPFTPGSAYKKDPARVWAATSATASAAEPLPGWQARIERKNRTGVTIRGIWFARRSIQDAAGCLKQDIRMSVRIRL